MLTAFGPLAKPAPPASDTARESGYSIASRRKTIHEPDTTPMPSRATRFNTAFTALVLALALAASADAQPQASELLGEHRWSQRLLLVFFSDPAPTQLEAWRDAIAASTCELALRDLIVAWLEAGRGGALDGKAVSAAATAALRREFGLHDEDFAVVLIGKDGAPKARYAGEPELSALLARIDGMPMRRAEAARQHDDCSD